MKFKPSGTQEEVKRLYKKNEWNTEPSLLLLAMQEELGEMVARWLAEHPDYEKLIDDTDTMSDGIGDLGQLIYAFCNTQNISFEECVKESIKKRRVQHLENLKK